MTERRRAGRVTGYLFKLIRESIPRSQGDLAGDLGVDRATVQGWESGRRPLTSVAVSQSIALRHRLSQLGASSALLAEFGDAAEADYLLSAILEMDPRTTDLASHPLGGAVMTHGLTAMLAWAVADQTPVPVVRHRSEWRRRGPVAAGPELDAGERRAFFANLEVIAERARRRSRDVLLHRQTCFIAGFDPSGSVATWLAPARRTLEHFGRPHGWSTSWADARSLAASFARQGDPQPLRDFIARAHPDQVCELAGLNYWAYWVGECGYRQHDDLFMTDPKLPWRGASLMRHLVDRLDSDHVLVDLNVHSLWALLAARRGLSHDDPDTTRDLVRRGTRLIDEARISSQSRRELASMLYGLRIEGFTGKVGV